MRLVNVGGRAGLLVDGTVFDAAEASGGGIDSDPQAAMANHFDDLIALSRQGASSGGVPLESVALGPPVPAPPVVLSVVANFPPSDRADFPMIVGKSPTAVVGPYDDIVLPDAARLPLKQAWVIPEPELGIVTRRAGRHLSADDAAAAIAGFVVAQDVTERQHEFGPGRSPWTWADLPAKTLGKSFDTFCPTGPALVSLDELAEPDRLGTRCWVNDSLVFDHSTADMLWSATQLVALVSTFMTLPAGLLVLAGSGGAIEGSRVPFLAPGDEVRTEIAGLGTMLNRCAAETG